MKFSPEEMDYEAPADVSHLQFRRVNPNVVVIDPDIAKVFKTAAEVNLALRKIIEAMPATPRSEAKRKRRTKRAA